MGDVKKYAIARPAVTQVRPVFTFLRIFGRTLGTLKGKVPVDS
jgi:hypothetical protein